MHALMNTRICMYMHSIKYVLVEVAKDKKFALKVIGIDLSN